MCGDRSVKKSKEQCGEKLIVHLKMKDKDELHMTSISLRYIYIYILRMTNSVRIR